MPDQQLLQAAYAAADKYGVPRICFINKLDRAGASFDRSFESIITRLGDSEPQDRSCTGDADVPSCEQTTICSGPTTARCNAVNYLDVADASADACRVLVA